MNYPDYISHHGIKGQKWGVRRYQNEDGSLTPEGKKLFAAREKKAARAVARADKYEMMAAKKRLRADKKERKRDKIRGRLIKTDISNWRADHAENQRARATTKALKYDLKAKKLRSKASRWTSQNKQLMNAKLSDI